MRRGARTGHVFGGRSTRSARAGADDVDRRHRLRAGLLAVVPRQMGDELIRLTEELVDRLGWLTPELPLESA